MTRKTIQKTISLILTLSMLLLLSACGTKRGGKYDEERAMEIIAQFEKLAAVPRQSGHCEAIAKMLMSWAEENSYAATMDKTGNVKLEVPATEGMEDSPLTILQSHMDMVCEPQPMISADQADSVIEYKLDEDGNVVQGPVAAEEIEDVYDPLTDSIVPIYDDGILMGDGTSLGADGGMGIAIVFDYLTKEKAHGPLRLIFTVDNETDHKGAINMDESWLKDATYFINLDGESSEEIVYGAYGQKTITAIDEDIEAVDPTYHKAIMIQVTGLRGGRASKYAGSKRLNGNKVLSGMLEKIIDAGIHFDLVSCYGGNYGDELAPYANATLFVNESYVSDIWNIVKAEAESYKAESGTTEKYMEVTITEAVVSGGCLAKEDSDRFFGFLFDIEDGMVSGSTLSNLGEIRVSTNGMATKFIVASSQNDSLDEIFNKQTKLAESYGFATEISEYSEVWPAYAGIDLLTMAAESYEDIFGAAPEKSISKEGLENGFFALASPDLQIISIGPDIFDVHTVEEFCNMESVVKLSNMLASLLEKIGKQEGK